MASCHAVSRCDSDVASAVPTRDPMALYGFMSRPSLSRATHALCARPRLNAHLHEGIPRNELGLWSFQRRRTIIHMSISLVSSYVWAFPHPGVLQTRVVCRRARL